MLHPALTRRGEKRMPLCQQSHVCITVAWMLRAFRA